MTQEKETAPSRGSSAPHQTGETSSAKQTRRGAKSSTPLTIKKQPRWLHHQGQQPSSASGTSLPNTKSAGSTWERVQTGRPSGLHLIRAPRNNIPQRRSWLEGKSLAEVPRGIQELCLAVPFCEAREKMWRLGWKPCASFPYFPEDLEGTREQKCAGLVTSAH